ncbi:MAG TPA: hypothetical protein VGJ02_11180 [Pyrinomonadaceae bacterium]
MSVETVVSIVESAFGGVSTTTAPMTAAEYTVWATPAWVARLRYLRMMGMDSYIEDMAASFLGKPGGPLQAALSQIAAEEQAVTIAAADAAATAAEGTLVAGAGTIAAAVVVPVIAMAAVGVALGAGYYQAREEARKEGYASGFSKGFVTGLLQWEVRFTIDRFWDNATNQNGIDEQLPTIRANAHNKGLLKGRVAAIAMTEKAKKTYLRGLRKLVTTSTAGWTSRSDDWMEQMRARQVQIGYVIDLATAATRYGIIKIE